MRRRPKKRSRSRPIGAVGAGRRPLPDHLPRVEVLRDLDDDEKICPNDPSHVLQRLGEERAERIVYRPAELYVEVEIRPSYACGTCKDHVACQRPSPQPIPKSMASASLLAQIATAKYVDGLPLARQEAILARLGIDLPRATLASWMIRCGDLVQPVTDLLLERIRAEGYVLADETPFQVLKEKGKRAQSLSYLWALRGEDPDHPLLYYEYAPTRSGEVARRLLAGFEGFLQTDGYAGYDGFEGVPGVVHVGCFAHARRKFDEALRGQGKQKGKKTNKSAKERVADQGLTRINALFRTERSYAAASPEERQRLRQEKLAPRLEELRAWATAAKDRVPPTSLTGKAIDYPRHAVAEARACARGRTAGAEYECRGARDPSLRDRAQGVAVRRYPERCHGERAALQPGRDREGQRGSIRRATWKRSSRGSPWRAHAPTTRRSCPGASPRNSRDPLRAERRTPPRTRRRLSARYPWEARLAWVRQPRTPRLPASHAVNVPDGSDPFGRFSSDHPWPLLGVHRGS